MGDSFIKGGVSVRVCASQTLKNEHEQLFVGYSL